MSDENWSLCHRLMIWGQRDTGSVHCCLLWPVCVPAVKPNIQVQTISSLNQSLGLTDVLDRQLLFLTHSVELFPWQGALLNPCRCDGSVRYTHQHCLLKWISERGSWTCELCCYRFQVIAVNMKRPWQVTLMLQLAVPAPRTEQRHEF